MNRLKLFIPVFIFATLGIVFYFALGRDTSEIPSPLLNKQVPEFAMPSLYDLEKTITTEDFKGEYALINVWATWCPPCRAEHPFLLELADQGIPIYGINWNERSRQDALRWLEQLGDPFELIVYDPSNKLGIDFGVYGAPETFLINPEGVILHKFVGELRQSVWEEQFLPKMQSQMSQASE